MGIVSKAVGCIGCEGHPVAPNDPCALCGLAASPSPSEMEVNGAPDEITLAPCPTYGWEHPDRVKYGVKYVQASQAQSALAAMRAERDEAIGWPKRSDVTHYCTDCEMVAVVHEGRCGCGSGRVVSIASMWRRAEAAEAQVLRLTEENEALRKGAEPELSCPHLDAFIASTNPPAEAVEEIETARNINSQLRYGLWHEKARAEAAEARIKALEEALMEIRELNTTGADENGHRWSHSDLIDQVIIPLLKAPALKENAL